MSEPDTLVLEHPRLAPTPVPLLVAVVHVLTIALALIAWYGSSGVATPDCQIPWVALALFGPVLSGAVNGVWLLIARRALGIRQRKVSARIREVRDQYAPTAARAIAGEGAVSLVALEGMSFYHRAGCVLVQGRPGARTTNRRPDHEAAGRRPCGWCQP